MKKVLLLIISLILLAPIVWAYETVLIDFPDDEGWHAVYYQQYGTESILQYVPRGESTTNWNRTLIFHSYKNGGWTNNCKSFMDRTTMQMESKNSTGVYKYRKYSDVDAIATRCIKKNALMPSQCEIFRVSKSFEGLISMHYINKDVQDYKNTYNDWFDIVQDIRIYRSYYRDDRILDKADTYEL